MPSVTAAILLLTFCSWARAVPACVRGTTAAATTSSGLKSSIIFAQLPAIDSGTHQGFSSTQGPRKSDGFLATTSKSQSWSSSNFDGSIRITTAPAPTQPTSAAQALTSAAHTAESSSSSELPETSEKIATSAAQVSNIAATTRQVTLTKATVISSGKASSAAQLVSATWTGSLSSKMGVSWPIQEKDASPIAQFFVPTSTVSWWFDWNKNWNQGILSADGVSIAGQFIPMLFDRTFFDNSDTLQDGFTEIMGYNEPGESESTCDVI
ncbi:hypothetical protein D1P53_000639 [Cryptococcus gattii VGV]|nr:hypothetical protein D1P53_000639 [Cryptococcus gattii VGV]